MVPWCLVWAKCLCAEFLSWLRFLKSWFKTQVAKPRLKSNHGSIISAIQRPKQISGCNYNILASQGCACTRGTSWFTIVRYLCLAPPCIIRIRQARLASRASIPSHNHRGCCPLSVLKAEPHLLIIKLFTLYKSLVLQRFHFLAGTQCMSNHARQSNSQLVCTDLCGELTRGRSHSIRPKLPSAYQIYNYITLCITSTWWGSPSSQAVDALETSFVVPTA